MTELSVAHVFPLNPKFNLESYKDKSWQVQQE